MPVANHAVRIMLKSYLDTYPEDAGNLARLSALLADAVDVTSRDEPRGHLTASAVVVNTSGLVLVVHHLASGLWIQPGGHPEPEDDTLAGAAARELAEETGITPDHVELVAPEPIQVYGHTTPVRYATGEPEHLHFDCRFLFRTSADVARLQASEVGGADWVAPDRFPDEVLRDRLLTLPLG